MASGMFRKEKRGIGLDPMPRCLKLSGLEGSQKPAGTNVLCVQRFLAPETRETLAGGNQPTEPIKTHPTTGSRKAVADDSH